MRARVPDLEPMSSLASRVGRKPAAGALPLLAELSFVIPERIGVTAISRIAPLYRVVAERLCSEIAEGLYPIGHRIPAEREVAKRFKVNRQTARGAIIALEVLGLVEVRMGSGAHVLRLPGSDERSCYKFTMLEVAEARLLFEGTAAALAVPQITDGEIEQLERLVEVMQDEATDRLRAIEADRAFHVAIAAATRNAAVTATVGRLWKLQCNSLEPFLPDRVFRQHAAKSIGDEHSAIVRALKARDAIAAQAAMRAHHAAFLDGLLLAVEVEAMEEARRAVAIKRARYSGNVL